MQINVATPIHCEIENKDLQILKPCLQYMKEFWKQGQYRKERKTYSKALYFTKKGKGYFLRGLKDRVDNYCKTQSIPVEWINNDWKINCTQEPYAKGIEFRDYQKRLIKTAIQKQRGVIKSPTGSGKTIIALGIMSCIPQEHNILFLCHTISLIKQTVDNLVQFGFDKDDIGTIVGGTKEIKRITVATIQSFKTVYKNLVGKFQVIFVDECHHVNSFNGMYAKVLGSMLAPMRIGMTATLSNKEEGKLALEGYIGPVIDEVTIAEASGLGILAKPKIKLVKLQYSHNTREERSYKRVYQIGVVESRNRNRAIVKIAKTHVDEGKSVLIIVNMIEHGENLVDMAGRVFDFDIYFVRGATEGEVRSEIQTALIEKDIKCVVSTSVWKEGVDIPSLDVLINGAGGKSELATLQTIGRGLRKTEDKSEILIYDFFDPSHPFLVSHFGERVCLYMDMGWM